MDIVAKTIQILSKSSELLQEPAVADAISEFIQLLKNILSDYRRARERLEIIVKMEANEKIIKGLQTNLDDLLYENEELKKQLEEKLQEIHENLKDAGIQIKIEGDENINFFSITSGLNDILKITINDPDNNEQSNKDDDN